MDSWLPTLGYLGLDRLSEAVARVNGGAQDAGRDPESIRKICNLGSMIGAESRELFQGSVQQWLDQLAVIVERFGINGFVYWPSADHERQIAVFAEEVVPAFRRLVAAHR